MAQRQSKIARHKLQKELEAKVKVSVMLPHEYVGSCVYMCACVYACTCTVYLHILCILCACVCLCACVLVYGVQ